MTPNLLRRGAMAALALLAAAVFWRLIPAHLERGCAIDDAPYLGLCPAEPAPGPSPEYLALMRGRLADNPGDSASLVRLAFFSEGGARDALLALARRLAPADPNVLALAAAGALARQDWPAAAAALVPLVEHHDNADAARALAGMVGTGHAAALRPLITPGSVWLNRVLAVFPEARVPFPAALPLIAPGVKMGIVLPSQALESVRQLKAAGAWVDAYSLWAALQPGPLPLLYNGFFEQALQPQGFDWEPGEAARPGVSMSLETTPERRGAVLVLDYNGREIPVPQLRQHLFLAPGGYRFEGVYRAARLKIEHGLVWTVYCASAQREVARTVPLGDTGGRWRSFALDIELPRNCGSVAALRLETAVPLDAAVGGRGRAEFAELRLGRRSEQRVSPKQ